MVGTMTGLPCAPAVLAAPSPVCLAADASQPGTSRVLHRCTACPVVAHAHRYTAHRPPALDAPTCPVVADGIATRARRPPSPMPSACPVVGQSGQPLGPAVVRHCHRAKRQLTAAWGVTRERHGNSPWVGVVSACSTAGGRRLAAG